MTWTFDLPFPKPPIGLSANDRVHWGAKSKSTSHVRAAVFIAALHGEIPKMERCRVDVAWVVKDRRRRDTDNLAPLLKAIYDGLGADTGMSAHIVPDDAPAYMEKPGATIRYEPGSTPHFEVIITDLS